MNKLFFLILILSITCCSYKNINHETGPDLIIASVSFKVNLEDGKDQTGMPVRSDYKTLNITLVIKNIGTKPFNSQLYVASTNSEEDLRMNYFSSFKLVEPSPTNLLPNESIEINFVKRVERNSSRIKFQVNYHSDLEKIAKESDYFNNAFYLNY